MSHSLTAFKPNLEQVGKFKIKKNISMKKVVAVIAALPLGTSWMFLLIPFMKGVLQVRI